MMKLLYGKGFTYMVKGRLTCVYTPIYEKSQKKARAEASDKMMHVLLAPSDNIAHTWW